MKQRIIEILNSHMKPIFGSEKDECNEFYDVVYKYELAGIAEDISCMIDNKSFEGEYELGVLIKNRFIETFQNTINRDKEIYIKLAKEVMMRSQFEDDTIVIEVDDGKFVDIGSSIEHMKRVKIDGKNYITSVGMSRENGDIEIKFINLSTNSQKGSVLRKLLDKGITTMNYPPPDPNGY